MSSPESNARDLVRRAHGGEREAITLLARIGRYLGAAIASFVNALEPELIVIGGGFGEAVGEFLLGSAREVLQRMVVYGDITPAQQTSANNTPLPTRIATAATPTVVDQDPVAGYYVNQVKDFLLDDSNALGTTSAERV